MTADFDRPVDLYRRRIARCRTENQVNQVHIALENYLVPAELRGLGLALRNDPPESLGRQWVESRLVSLPLNKPRPVEFERSGNLRGLTRYSADIGSPEQKTLIVGFAGFAHRLMLPTAFVLDCLNPAWYDLIVLRDFAKRLYVQGIPGLGDSFFDVLSGLSTCVDLPSYRNVVAFGTSGGGHAAVLAAIALRLDKGISIGGAGFEQLEATVRSLGLDVGPFRALVSARPDPYPDLLLVYAGDHARDEAGARSIGKLVPARLMKVRDCGKHGVLGHYSARRQLPEFLSLILGQDVENPTSPARRPLSR